MRCYLDPDCGEFYGECFRTDCPRREPDEDPGMQILTLLSVTETAKLLGVKPVTLKALVYRNRLHPVRGTYRKDDWVFSLEDVNNYMRERAVALRERNTRYGYRDRRA